MYAIGGLGTIGMLVSVASVGHWGGEVQGAVDACIDLTILNDLNGPFIF